MTPEDIEAEVIEAEDINPTGPEASVSLNSKSLLKEIGEMSNEIQRVAFAARDSPDALVDLLESLSLAHSTFVKRFPTNMGMIRHNQKDKWRSTKVRAPFAKRKRKKATKRIGVKYEKKLKASDVSIEKKSKVKCH